MKLIWLIIAGAGIAVAAVFMWFLDFNKAFVAAAIGLVAWFLNYRMQIKRELTDEELKQSSRSESEEFDEK